MTRFDLTQYKTKEDTVTDISGGVDVDIRITL